MRNTKTITPCNRQYGHRFGKTAAVGVTLLFFILFWSVASANDLRPGKDYPKVFRYGVLNLLNGVNQRDAQVAVEMNLRRSYWKEMPGLKVELTLLSDASKSVALLAENKLHGMALSGIDFVALKEKVSVMPLFFSSRQDTPVESYVLLVAKEMTLEKLAQLPQRRLIMENLGKSNVSLMWLDTVLWDKGQPATAEFFSAIREADKPARMVLPVFFGQVEACLVPESAFLTMAELNPQIGQKLTVFARSPGFVRSVHFVRKDLPPYFISELKHSAIHMDETADGVQLLMIFQLKRNYPYDPEYMVETEKLYRRFHEMKTASMGKWKKQLQREPDSRP